MTPVSQIIWKNRNQYDSAEPLLLVCPPNDGLAMNLSSEGYRVAAVCHSHATHEQLAAAGIESQFAVSPPNPSRYAQVILFQPREKTLLEMMLNLLSSRLTETGRLWLAGANRGGIRSAAKRLANHFENQRKVDSARHCGLFVAHDPLSNIAADPESFLQRWTFVAAGREWKICSLPGVFAHGRLDDGSRLLIDTLTSPDLAAQVSGRVLDFACGAGVIGIPLAASRPDCEVTLLDDSAIALAAARHSLTANDAQATVLASDGLATILDGEFPPFDWIVSNPPFHSGVEQDLRTAECFIRDCPRALSPRGKLCLVANMHLPYGRWLQELFETVQVIASDRGYNIWLAEHRAGDSRPLTGNFERKK